jgi:hypothetical protein
MCACGAPAAGRPTVAAPAHVGRGREVAADCVAALVEAVEDWARDQGATKRL